MEGPPRTFAFTFGLERLGLIALRAPWVSAMVIALLSVLAIWGVTRLKVDDSLSELFRTNTLEFRSCTRNARTALYYTARMNRVPCVVRCTSIREPPLGMRHFFSR